MRDLNDPRWKATRFACFSRDNFTCQRCGKKDKKLNGHHIQKVADFPELEFLTSNVISLCIDCHRLVTGHEELYEDEFKKIIAQKRILKDKKRKSKIYRKPKWKNKNPRNFY